MEDGPGGRRVATSGRVVSGEWICLARLEDVDPVKVAMVAALEREVGSLVKRWRRVEREHEGRRFKSSRASTLWCCAVGSEQKLPDERLRL